MNIQEIKQQKVREVLRQYVADDGLKPSADGMTAYELAGIILREAESAENEAQAKDMFAKQYPDSRVNNDGENNEYEEVDKSFPHEKSAWV